ncbi:twin-arginine translocation pathway signal [Cyanobium sp. FGCU-6]|jgi:putative spermidine/putrescine transport system substrate-binding protein|nr:twin-arginine translocation pathway signal [Cyanobium sp. FGCU6]
MAERLLPRRTLLRLAASTGLGLPALSLLGGCRAEAAELLAVRGELPAGWARRLPSPWRLRQLDDPAAVRAALLPPAAGSAASARPRTDGSPPALIQLGDGWATSLPRPSLQPIGTPALLARLAPLAAPVQRLFAPEGSPALAWPWSLSPWVLVLRDRPDLAARAADGWDLLLDPSLAGRVVLPSSPRVTIALVEGDLTRLRRLRAHALASDDRDGLRLLLSGPAQAAVVPRQRVVPLLRSDPRLQVVLPAEGGPLTWNLLLRPTGDGPAPPIDWLAEILEPPLLPRLLAAGWVPPLPRPLLQQALKGFPAAMAAILLPPAVVQERWRDLPPLPAQERLALQHLWDEAAPPPG